MDSMKCLKPYRVATDKYEEEILHAFKDVLQSGMFVLGDWTKEFENSFAESHGRGFGIAVNSDTAALEMALTYLKEKKGLERVLLPDTAFFGCVNVVLRLGLHPIIVPTTLHNGVMPTLAQLTSVLERLPKVQRARAAYMAVYTAGTVGVDAVEQIDLCDRYGVPVIEDCAHCHGATYMDGRLVGSHGHISTFSFYATKLIHTGEGGILLCDDQDMRDWMATYRNYGKAWGPMEDPVFARPDLIGYNWRMTEFQAAIGVILWRNREEIIRDRSVSATVYDAVCKDVSLRKLIYRLPVDGSEKGKLQANLYKYIVIVPPLKTVEDNHCFAARLRKKGVLLQAKCNSIPLSRMDAYKGMLTLPKGYRSSIHDADLYSMSHIALPIYPGLAAETAQVVVHAIVETIRELQSGF